MSNALKEKREKAVYLRHNEGLSYNEISDKLGGVSKGTLNHWLKNVQLNESQKKRLREKNPARNPSSGHIQKMISGNIQRCRDIRLQHQKDGAKEAVDLNLYQAGCMLYWAEGGKGRHAIRFTNTDVDMMRLFIRFLIECFGVSREKISICCHSHILSDKTLQEVEVFWLKQLSLPKECLRKGFVETRIPKKKTVKYPYGICSLTVCSVELVHKIYGSIKAYAGIVDEEKWLN